jgi:hypothetical protein
VSCIVNFTIVLVTRAMLSGVLEVQVMATVTHSFQNMLKRVELASCLKC